MSKSSPRMIRNRPNLGAWLAVGATCALAWILGGAWIDSGRQRSAVWEERFSPVGVAIHQEAIDSPPSLDSEAAAAVVFGRRKTASDGTQPVEGEEVDSRRPAIYRLPTVDRFEELPAVTPPTPTSADPILDLPLPQDLAQEFDRDDRPGIAVRPAQPSAALPVAGPPAGPYLPQRRMFTPVSTELTTQLLPAVQRGCDLAQRGALYAARTEFIQVIRRVAQANDATFGTDVHSRALAEGLRALDEASDFVPNGAGLEGDLDVAIAASSHRTPHVRVAPDGIAPHTAVAIYHGFAQERLAEAVGGQQAGSMALFGLGKVHARIAEREDGDALSTRSAMTMYLAALAACPSNHLAANELGVLLCRNGLPGDAAQMFERAIDQAPSATAYHNLSVAQHKLGFVQQAQANQREADRLAAWERSTGALSRRAGVQWVNADQFAHVAPPLAATAGMESLPPPGSPPPKSPLQRVASMARSLAVPDSPTAAKGPATGPPPRPTPWH